MLKRAGSIVLLAAAGTVALAPLSAPAAEVTGELTRVIPASECVLTLGNDAKISPKGNLYNSSTTASYSVNCPVQYEFHTFGEPTSFLVALTDKSSVADFSCYVAVLAVDGVSEFKGPAVSTSGKWTAGGSLILAAPGISGGSWQVRCSIPKRGSTDSSSILSAILMYQEVL
jgi:hypothetical protein